MNNDPGSNVDWLDIFLSSPAKYISCLDLEEMQKHDTRCEINTEYL